jgi:hypothetical protein
VHVRFLVGREGGREQREKQSGQDQRTNAHGKISPARGASPTRFSSPPKKNTAKRRIERKGDRGGKLDKILKASAADARHGCDKLRRAERHDVS